MELQLTGSLLTRKRGRKVKASIEKSIEMIGNKLSAHEGSGDAAHITADNQHSGFISAQDYRKLYQGLGERVHLKEGTDILATQPGRYYGQSLVNSPVGASNTALLLIDIDWASQKQVQYRVTVSYTGKTYYRNVHMSGDDDNGAQGWSWEPKYLTLWEGNVTAPNTILNLVDNIYKFEDVRVTLNNANGEEVRVTTPRSATMTFNLTHPWLGQFGLSVFQVALKINNPSSNGGTQLIVARNYSNSFTDKWESSTGLAQVKRIEGVI